MSDTKQLPPCQATVIVISRLVDFPTFLFKVSATFAASLITSPALGSYLQGVYNDNVVIALATAVAVLDILFILLVVPESLPERMRPASWGAPVSWEQADPFNVSSRLNKVHFMYSLFFIHALFSAA